MSFLVSPKVVLNSYGCCTSYGYVLDSDNDEVFRFPAGHPKALSIINKLSRLNATQWSEPSYDIIEEEFDLEDFFEEQIYQDNYDRLVTFHTNLECQF